MTLSVNFYKNFIQFKNMEYFVEQHKSCCAGVFKVDPLFKSENKQKKVCNVCGAIAFIRMSGTSIIFEGHIPKVKLGIRDTPNPKAAKTHCAGCGVWVDTDTTKDNLCASCRNTGPAMSAINYDDEYKDSPGIITWQQGQAREVSAGKIDDCDKEYDAKNHSIYSPPREQHRLLDVSNEDVDALYKAHLADKDNVGKLRVYKNAESRNAAMYTRMMRAQAKKKRDVMDRELERDYKEREVEKAGGRKECIRRTLLPLIHVLENAEREEYKRNIAGLVYLLGGKKPVLTYEQHADEELKLR